MRAWATVVALLQGLVAAPSPTAAGSPPLQQQHAAGSSAAANAHDDAWQLQWTANARQLLANRSTGDTAFVLQIGDSITYANPYSQWPRYGAGKTMDDKQACDWASSDEWDSGEAWNFTVQNGWYFAAKDIPGGNRAATAASGIRTDSFLCGCDRAGTNMPLVGDPQESAQATLVSGLYGNNINFGTLCFALRHADFAVIMLGTNDVNAQRPVADFTRDLGLLLDLLRVHNIVAVPSTIPPHHEHIELGESYNSAIRQLAASRALPLIDFHAEILARRPGASWNGTLLGLNDVHPTASSGGYDSASDPYADGGDPEKHRTGAAAENVGYLLRSWLTVQKFKELRAAVFLPVSTPPPPPLEARQLLWYLGDYSTPYVAENEAFIGTHADAINGVLHCCGGPSVTSNGTMVVPQATLKLYSELTQPEVALKLSPVMLPLSPDPWSVQSGQAVRAVPALVDLVVQLGVTGLIADYEPHGNTTAAHAKAFASFLTALSSALHAKHKKLGVCVSDWGIIGPNYYKLHATAQADLYVSMGSTYKLQGGPTAAVNKLNVLAMTAAFPLSTIAVGIGTMVPAGPCAATSGLLTGDYKWTEATLSPFLEWVGAQGIDKLGVWPADIAALLYKQPHYCGVEPVRWRTYILHDMLCSSR